MNEMEKLNRLAPYIKRAGFDVPNSLDDLSLEQRDKVLRVFARDPFFLDGLTQRELESRLKQYQIELDALKCAVKDAANGEDSKQWKEEISELEDKIDAIDERLMAFFDIE